MPFLTQGKTNWKYIIIVVILAVSVGGGALWFSTKKEQPYQPPEIKKPETANWKTYRNEEYGFEVKYPEELGQEYIKAHTWPPTVTLEPINPDFICEEFEKVKTQEFPTATQKKIIWNNSEYCLFIGAEGAMGTTYVTYRYMTNRGEKQLTLEFVLRIPNCGVFYGINNKMEECRKEIEDFETTALVDKMLFTFKFLE